MATLRKTKAALVTSTVALLLCFAMLVGSTFAWFTDSVSSEGNVIKSGTLDVELWQHTAEGSVEITDSSAPIFGKADSTTANANTANTLWEPGKTQTVYLSIKNVGSLDMKYKVALEVTEITKNLNDVVEYIITPNATPDNPVTKAGLDWENNGKSVVSGINVATEDVPLNDGAEHFFAISVHMDENAKNDYMDGTIVFNLRVLAGQLTSESDSFDNLYDYLAVYPEVNASYEIDRNGDGEIVNENGEVLNGIEIEFVPEGENNALGTATIPADAIDPNATNVVLNITKSNYENSNIIIDTGHEKIAFDVSVGGLKSDNDVDVKVKLRIPTGLDLNTVKAYHYDEPIPSVYNYESGMVGFETADFSPFTITYDPNSIAQFDPNDIHALPQAFVVNKPQYENTHIEWGGFGGVSPDYTVDADPKLEGVFEFSAIQNLDQATASDYANWTCDFYVMLDKDLGANQIFLGGNYGDFGWVGFHNGDLTLEANTEIPLLGSVTQNPWTYADVVGFVQTFLCGVGDVNDALSGATFTVSLRLTNPDDATEFYDVAVITHTFS